jgi:hypothetical protein
LLFTRFVLPAAVAHELEPTIHGSVAQAVEDFARSTVERLAATVTYELAGLAEPRPACRERAMRLLPLLVDTLVGFAIGGAAGDLVDRIRTAQPAADRAWIRRRVSGVARRNAPDASSHRLAGIIADRDRRPLVDELGSLLLPAVMRGQGALRMIAAEAAAASVPSHAVRVLATPALCDTAALRLADQIEYGWGTYAAAISRAPAPAIPHPPSRELWSEWLRRVRHEPETANPAVAVATAATTFDLGAILRITR